MNFTKKHNYLICIDSDGCAVDSMTIKHQKAFGPAFVETYHLEEFAEPILAEWNRINLYSLERGINRFKGLAKILQFTNQKYKKMTGIEKFADFVNGSTELNVKIFEKAFQETGNPLFEKAVAYSNRVNELIEEIPEENIQTFDYVADTLKSANNFADVVVVSSANKAAVESEWKRLSISQYVKNFFTQEDGTKTQIINRLKESCDYSNQQILKIGDSMGDFDAASSNHVSFYPILVNEEGQSWRHLGRTYLQKFKTGEFSQAEKKLEKMFFENLKN